MNKWLRVKIQGDVISVGHVQRGLGDLFDSLPDVPNVPHETFPADTERTALREERPSRGRVTELTASSRRRMLVYLSTCRSAYTGMVTLTLPSGLNTTNGKEVKERLHEMARFMLSEMTMPAHTEPSVFWALEFQANGSPHFHLLINGWIGKGVVSHRWAQMWTLTARGSSRQSVQLRGEEMMESMMASATQVKGLDEDSTIAGYIAKYMGKDEQKLVPPGYTDVGRFWGVYGERRLKGAALGFLPLYSACTGDISFEVQSFWCRFNRKMTESTTNVRMIPWKMGNGVTIYRKGGVSREEFMIIGKELLCLCSDCLPS